MTIRAIDCQGFAGGFTLGVAQAGLTLVGKREMGPGFGVANCEANRQLLGHSWFSESCDPIEWSVPHGGAEVVFGNPPCSGFSGLSPQEFRGVDSPINHCMWAFVDYVARVDPLVAIFESVQAAYNQGHKLMRQLHERLEEKTGHRWNLHHVLHDAYALGGVAVRKRYFWVASRVPFGVEQPVLPLEPKFGHAIADLNDLDLTWLPQPYRQPPSRWARDKRSSSGVVDGHVTDGSIFVSRIHELASRIEWPFRKGIGHVMRMYYEEHGQFPESWRYLEARKIENGFNFGFHAISRWDPERPARVITGAGTHATVHPWQPRVLTYREVARVMGFPDDWLIYPLRNMSQLRVTWGKGITVQAGRWIATWAKNSICGEPGSVIGKQLDEREFEIKMMKPLTYHRDRIHAR